MRVIATKRSTGDGDGSYTLELRAEDIPEGLEDAEVSLARNGNHCFYRLDSLEDHDGHAPPWLKDGRAPKASSAPKMTASRYLERIREDVRQAVEEYEDDGDGDEIEVFPDGEEFEPIEV